VASSEATADLFGSAADLLRRSNLLLLLCGSKGFVGDGDRDDSSRPSQAPQGEDGGRRRARRLGRGRRRPVQLHPCRPDARHGLPQECMHASLLITPFFPTRYVLPTRLSCFYQSGRYNIISVSLTMHLAPCL
jgi:hypothetical protein